MPEKKSSARNYILRQLEDGTLKAGEKLSGAREIARLTGRPLPAVQSEIELLAQEGVLETVPRRGTFVSLKWDSRILRRNLSLYRPDLTWFDDFRKQLEEEIPEIWVTGKFKRSVFEIQTTHYVQSHYDEYLDLTDIFAECFPDTDDFFMETFSAFRVGTRLMGVPIIYSPRVIFYNPRLLREAGCRIPAADWSMDEFRYDIRKLCEILPAEDTFCWYPKQFYWFNFVLRCGGTLIDPNAEESVRIDSPETRAGLKLFRDLRYDMGIRDYHYPDDFETNFLTGRAGMLIQPREFLSYIKQAGFDEWETVPLPSVPGGVNLNVQATDVFCVRRECVDLNLAARLLRLLLSERFQSCLGDQSYGLPIRRSLTGKSVDFTDARDTLFLSEIPHMYSQYNLDSAELYNLVCDGVAALLAGDEDIDTGTAELARMTRTFLKIRRQSQQIA